MKRTLHISDIHGQYDKLKKLLELVKYDPAKDQLILHGDYVDRGKDNIKTLLFISELQKQGAIVLKGNHDEMMQLAIEEISVKVFDFNIKVYLECGGINTYHELIKLTDDELTEIYYFISNLPYIYTFDNYICVHAGVNPMVSLEENDTDSLIWSRNKFIPNKCYDDKIIIFGHTPTSKITGIDRTKTTIWFDQKHNDKIGIDCGSVFGGRLACLELPSMETYYV